MAIKHNKNWIDTMTKKQTYTVASLSLAIMLTACGGEDSAPEAPANEGAQDQPKYLDAHIQMYGCTVTPEQLTAGLQARIDEGTEGLTANGPLYEESINEGLGKRIVKTNSVPVGHNMGDFPYVNSMAPANTEYVRENLFEFQMPMIPDQDGTLTQTGGSQTVGVATDGVHIHQGAGTFYRDDMGSGWQYDVFQTDLISDYTGETYDLGVDCNTGHPFPLDGDRTKGLYHYHGAPEALVPDSPEIKRIGWAADGNPIFARYGKSDPLDAESGIKVIEPSYRIKTGTRAGTGGEDGPGGAYDGIFVQDYEYAESYGDLDACNGREESVTVDGQTFAYAYYLTDHFPYVPSCLTYTPDESFYLSVNPGGPGVPTGPAPGEDGFMPPADGPKPGDADFVAPDGGMPPAP
jgi:hypothetical protein